MFRRAVRTAKAVPDAPTSYTLSGFARGFNNVISGRGKYRGKGQKPVRIRAASVRNRHVSNSLFGCQNCTVRNRIKTVPGFNSENPALLFLFIIPLQIRPPSYGPKRQDARRSHGHSGGRRRRAGNASGVCARMPISGQEQHACAPHTPRHHTRMAGTDGIWRIKRRHGVGLEAQCRRILPRPGRTTGRAGPPAGCTAMQTRTRAFDHAAPARICKMMGDRDYRSLIKRSTMPRRPAFARAVNPHTIYRPAPHYVGVR